MPVLAAEKVVSIVSTANPEVGPNSVLNPTERTLELSPNLRSKIHRSLEREARKLRIRFLLLREVSRYKIFVMNARCALLDSRSRFVRQSPDFALNRHLAPR
jgi:hypothetical protein